MPYARRAPTNYENPPGLLVRVTVTKPVSFRVGRLRKLLKTKNVTVRRYGHPCRDRSDENSIF